MKTRKVLLVLIALVLLVGMTPISALAVDQVDPKRGFSDMPNDWSTAALQHAVDNGLLVGANGKLNPKGNLTRAEMATIITRAFNAQVTKDLAAFPDVKTGEWYADYLAKAYQMQVIQGANGLMKPMDAITRQEAFVMIARALKLSPADEFAGSFSDVSDLAVWAKGGVAALANEGYVQGAAGKLSPTANITRAEFAQVMKNVIAHYINEAGTYTDDYSGNVMINVADVVLNGSEVTGDVILGDGVGDGDVTLEDVTISGKLVVRGGGANSIVIKGDSNIGTVIIARVDGEIRIIAEDGVKIDVVIIDDGSDDVVLEGEFGTVTVLAEGIVLDTSKATVEELVDETGTLEVVEPPAPPVVEDDDDDDEPGGGTVDPVEPEPDPAIATATNTEELMGALADHSLTTINISGTLGSSESYKAYEIDRPVTIQGTSGSKVYGSFIIKADGVKIDGLTIYTRGGGNGPLKAAVDVIAKAVTITNNTFELPNPEQLATNGGVGNGVTIWPVGDASPAYNISNNTFKGYQADTDTWSSTALQIAEGLDLARFGMSGMVTVDVSLDSVAEKTLATGNTYIDCTNSYVHSNWTGGLTYKYLLATTAEQLEGIQYMGESSTVLVAGTIGDAENFGEYVISKSINIIGTEDATIYGSLAVQADAVTFEGLKFVNVPTSGETVDNIKIGGVKNITFTNCEFNGNATLGEKVRAIDMPSSSRQGRSNITIENCSFYGGYYVAINGYANNVTVKNSDLSDCKSGINIIIGDNLVVESTDISVIAYGETNDTYGIRFANDTANSSSDLSIAGGSITVDKNNMVAVQGTYHSAIIVRGGASGSSSITGVNIAGEVVDLTNSIELANVLTNNTFPIGYVVYGYTIIEAEEDKVYNQTTGQAYDTIQGAVDVASNNDTILLGPGEYDVVILGQDNKLKNYLWLNKPITIKAANMNNRPDLKAQWEEGYGKGSHQQATVEITADNVTLEGLVIHEIVNYGDYAKVVEVTGANNFTIRGCDIVSTYDNVTSIYLNGEGVGKYTIESNTMNGGIVPANGAGNGTGGENSIIKDNSIGASISFTGRTNSGWDHISFSVYPTITGNNIGGLDLGDGTRMFINSRDLDGDKLISDEQMDSILSNNNFPAGTVEVVSDQYDNSSQYYANTYRKRLLLTSQ